MGAFIAAARLAEEGVRGPVAGASEAAMRSAIAKAHDSKNTGFRPSKRQGGRQWELRPGGIRVSVADYLELKVPDASLAEAQGLADGFLGVALHSKSEDPADFILGDHRVIIP